jgi:sigma-B regulation protein RsbU (phosphoserine phosphatase)
MTPGVLFAFYCILYTLYSLDILKGSYLFAYFICACVPLTVLIIFLMRFTEQQRENVRMADDMRQAEEVQHLLVPQHLPDYPGWLIESEYHPARQVGGDFFQVLPGDDGSLLIVVGDVSGKGLKAAMTVSAIVGALRGCTVRAPARVLAYLNDALHGQMSGFFTCCAALINDDGKLIIANAGHLPPYVNGEELEVSPGLPLGIGAETAYSETTHDLGPDDRLTFISDGVVEARNGRGELYGFARTKSISGHTAVAIARAAQRFGQEDDITVLTVMRAPEAGGSFGMRRTHDLRGI